MAIPPWRHWAASTTLWRALSSAAAGIAAFWLSQQHFKAQEALAREALRSRLATRQVVVASQGLASGHRLEASDMAVRDVPVRYAHGASLGRDAAPALLGRQLRHDLAAGDPILARDVEQVGHGSLAEELPEGLRAVTLAVDDVNAVAGHLQPGDRIDLFHVQPSRSAGAELQLLLQAVRVLAAGAARIGTDTAGTRDSDIATLVLQLTPDDAARLLIALRTGQVYTALRNPTDATPALVKVRNGRDLSAHRPATGRPRETPVQVISGGQRQPTAGISVLPSNPLR